MESPLQRSGPFTLGNVLLAILFVLLGVALTLGSTDAITLAQALLTVCFALPALYLSKRPTASAVASCALLACWSVTFFAALPANYGLSPVLIMAPLSVYTTARHCTNRAIPRAALALTVVASVVSPAMWIIDAETFQLHYRTGSQFVGGLLTHWLVLSFAYLLGVYLRNRDHQRHMAMQHAQEAERELIARELHDVLAHSLTLIKVQANAGIVSNSTESLAEIRDTADAALADVRSLVSSLREGSVHVPTDVATVIDKFRAAGLGIDTHGLAADRPPLPAVTRLAHTRIITEALTNALRHQGPGTYVTITWAGGELSIRSQNRHPQPAGHHVGARKGLVGLAERAHSLGGTFHADGTAEDFLVTATLPVKE